MEYGGSPCRQALRSTSCSSLDRQSFGLAYYSCGVITPRRRSRWRRQPSNFVQDGTLRPTLIVTPSLRSAWPLTQRSRHSAPLNTRVAKMAVVAAAPRGRMRTSSRFQTAQSLLPLGGQVHSVNGGQERCVPVVVALHQGGEAGPQPCMFRSVSGGSSPVGSQTNIHARFEVGRVARAFHHRPVSCWRTGSGQPLTSCFLSIRISFFLNPRSVSADRYPGWKKSMLSRYSTG